MERKGEIIRQMQAQGILAFGSNTPWLRQSKVKK